MTLEPTDAEQKLIAAVRGGRVADYSSGDPATRRSYRWQGLARRAHEKAAGRRGL